MIKIYPIRFVFLVLFGTGMLFLYSCKKDYPRQTAVVTKSMDVQTGQATGSVIDLGNLSITEHGFCWDKNENPTPDKNSLKFGGMNSRGDYSGQLTSLLPGNTYFLRAYAITTDETVYGNQISFTTPGLPTLTTVAVTDVTYSGAISGGNISNDGGSPVLTRGVCWNNSPNPDITNNHTIDGSGSVQFQSMITNLSASKVYYARAYASNIYGTQYGNEVTFTTSAQQTIPLVFTKDVTDITKTTAKSGGAVLSDGGSSVTVRGVCWNISPNPSVSNNHTTDGSGNGTFISNFSGLSPNTVYYLRAYATNGIGTGYGREISFTTSANLANSPMPLQIVESLE
ncbi:MAG: hypothetical protein WCI71_15130 [Bacteroidota bacterium]